MNRIYSLTLAFAAMTALARDPVESVAPDPMGGGTPVATNSPATTPTKEEPVADLTKLFHQALACGILPYAFRTDPLNY